MNLPEPPKRAVRFLEWFCPPALAEGILGDLYEAFDEDVETQGLRRARLRFTWNVIRFFRPGIILRNNYSFHLLNNNMWSNYLTIAGRNLAKRKMYSLINAVGLSIGIAFCMLIFLFIQDERRFDTFHTNSSSIYRVEEKAYDTWRDVDSDDPFYYSAWLQTGLRDVVLEEIPQVKRATRYNAYGDVAIRYEDEVMSEPITFVDPDFFEMFSFHILAGDKTDLLTEKHHVVLTESIAGKIFGEEDPLDKTLIITLNGEDKLMTVAGVLEDAPTNSSLDYGMLVQQQNRPYYERNLDRWQNFNTPLFVQLEPGSRPAEVESGLAGIIDRLLGENLEKQRKEYSVPEDVAMLTLELNNFENIHLDTRISWTRSSDPQYAYILGGLGILILIIACINYISLALTSSANRRSEVGIRKSIGAQRSELITQFTLEAVLLAVISLVLATGLVYLFLADFNEFTGKDISLDIRTTLGMLGTGLLVAFLIGILAGSYPSLYLSGLNPTSVLKKLTGKVNARFTRPLVVIQYALSGILIISSLIMLRQMNFLATKELGYNQDQLVVIQTNQGNNVNANRFVEQFRREMDKYPEILEVGGTSSSFAQGWSLNGYTIDGEKKSAYVYSADDHYIPALQIELLEGRNFYPGDSNVIIVNEALVKDMGWEDPLNEHLNWREDSLSAGSRVIGVVKDYHFLSLEQEIEPMFLMSHNEPHSWLSTLLVRVEASRIPEAIETLESSWKELAPEKPFDYTFLDEDVARQYDQYDRWTNIMTLSTAFAILISCLGLFGLAGINALNRTKEIGIRKVMGAPSWNIFMLMNRQFILLALISFTLAAPLSWWLMDQWLESFTYSIDIGWDIFLLSIITGLAVALLTVSYHSIRASRLNPVDTLKYE